MKEYKTYNSLIDYLCENIYNADFIQEHTRTDFSNILNNLEKHKNYSKSMTKTRQFKHIEFHLKLHGFNIERRGLY